MKIITVCSDRPWVKIGNTIQDAIWYSTKELKPEETKNLKTGVEVNIKFRKGVSGNILTELSLGGGSDKKEVGVVNNTKPVQQNTTTKSNTTVEDNKVNVKSTEIPQVNGDNVSFDKPNYLEACRLAVDLLKGRSDVDINLLDSFVKYFIVLLNTLKKEQI